MPRYVFTTNVTISMSFETQADSLESAIDLAREASVVGLCHQCAKGGDDGEWNTSGELDCGHPTEQKLEVLTVDGEDVVLTTQLQEKWDGT